MKFESKTMRLRNADSVPYLTYNALSDIRFINHAFSTRLGGVSEGEFTSMNLAFNRGDDPEHVTENYKRLCQSAGFSFDSLVASAQDHHTFVRAVTAADRGIGIYRPRDMESVDALVTNEQGVTLVTYYADCTPLFFVDVKNRAVGLAHAGWRGTVGRIGEKVIQKMTALYGTDPKDVIPQGGRQVHDRPARNQPSDTRRGRRAQRADHPLGYLHQLLQRPALEPPRHQGAPRHHVGVHLFEIGIYKHSFEDILALLRAV